MAVTIYLNESARELIKNIKITNPDFNLSEFVRKALEIEVTGKSESQEVILLGKLKELELQRESIDRAIDAYKERIKNFNLELLKIAEEREAKRKELEEDNSHAEYLKIIDIAVTDFFTNPNGRDIYLHGIKDKKWNSLMEFYEKYLKNESMDRYSGQ